MPRVLNDMNFQAKKLILVLAGIILSSNLFSQDSAVKKITLVLRDEARNNRKVPFDTRPSAIKAASSVKIPVLIFSGSNDCITPSGKHHLPIYYSLAGEIKTYISIKGGTHCQMGVSHPKCSTGEKIAGCREGISQEEQLRILAKYLIPWLNYHLKGDMDAGLKFNSFIGQDSTIEYIQSKPLPVECN